jgi:hypothetical protein
MLIGNFRNPFKTFVKMELIDNTFGQGAAVLGTQRRDSILIPAPGSA